MSQSRGSDEAADDGSVPADDGSVPTDDRTAAMDKALELLSFRARSESELEQRLRRCGHAPESVTAAVARCRELGYVDDRRYALTFVRDRLRLRPKGRRVLRTELFRKGIDRELAEEAIDAGFEDAGVDEHGVAIGLARKRLRSLGGLDRETARRRLFGYLARRGFPPPVVRAAVADLLPDAEAERLPD